MRYLWLILFLVACNDLPQKLAPPTIGSVSPRVAAVGGVVTIRGLHFDPNASVKIGQASANLLSGTTDELRVQMPDLELGEYEVTVINTDAQTDNKPGPAIIGSDDLEVVSHEALVTLEVGTTPSRAGQIASETGFEITEYIPAIANISGACGQPRAVFRDTQKRSTTDAINALQIALEALNPQYQADPRGIFGGSEIQSLNTNPTRATPVAINLPDNISNVKVAVLDTGVSDHPTFFSGGSSVLLPGQNLTKTDNPADPRVTLTDVSDLGLYTGATIGHGTGVAALIGARSSDTSALNVGSDAFGIASGVQILPVKVCASQNERNICYGSDVVQGVCSAIAHGANVINLSLGGRQAFRTLKNVLLEASVRGIVIVAAAGNSGEQDPTPRHYPAAYSLEIPGLISVASAQFDGTNWRGSSFSTPGASVSLAAPGEQVLTAVVKDRGIAGYEFASLDGTSFAAPQVAATAAILRAMHLDWTPAQIKTRLLERVTTTANCTNQKCGAGVLNVTQAIQP
jgi:subtilisin family serine protease